MKVIGIEKKEKVSKKTGKPYTSATLYCTYNSPTVTGVACQALFAMVDNIPADLKIGDEVQAIYNQFGNVDQVLRV